MRIGKTACILSALGAAALGLQAEELTTSVKVNIPYAVTAGSHQLSPGDYTIKEISGVGHIFGLFNSDGSQFEMFLPAIRMEEPEPAEHTDLTLRRDGSNYVLDELRIGGENTAFQFVTPRK